jgi:hexosaminidase
MVNPWGLATYPRDRGVLEKNTTMVQAWKTGGGLGWLLANKWQTVYSVESAWYLDCGHWCVDGAGSKSMPTFYNAPVPTSQFLVGGEAVAFTENWEQGMIDKVVWPRAAAVAERLWSDPAQARWPALVSWERVGMLDTWLGDAGIDPWPVETVMIG